jgi:AraC-like DNA-binding protein
MSRYYKFSAMAYATVAEIMKPGVKIVGVATSGPIMLKRSRPGIDRAIAPQHGVTPDGQPLSYNRVPSSDLAPWIAWLYVTIVDAPDDYQLNCGLFNDTAILRLQLKGEWTGQTARGEISHEREVLFFGPQSRRMPISVTGSFISIGISLRPGASHTLKAPKLSEALDSIIMMPQTDHTGTPIFDYFDPDGSPEDWVQTMETLMRGWISRTGAKEPDPLSVSFEALAFNDPGASISEFAQGMVVDQKRLERIIKRDFGLSPKKVLRRARALDMASHLRGVADQAEAEELMLRYYDQSHMIHEFTDLFGMSPGQFVERPQPILTLTLESRQAWRLGALDRLPPGAPRPWV